MARIIIVDDDDVLADTIVQILSGAGHFADAVGSGEEAIAAIEQDNPDLVILDYCLPGLTDMQVLRDIRTLPYMHTIPVMMMTGKSGLLLARRAELDGADDYVTKPFDPADLLRRIKSLLMGARIARATFSSDAAGTA